MLALHQKLAQLAPCVPGRGCERVPHVSIASGAKHMSAQPEPVPLSFPMRALKQVHFWGQQRAPLSSHAHRPSTLSLLPLSIISQCDPVRNFATVVMCWCYVVLAV